MKMARQLRTVRCCRATLSEPGTQMRRTLKYVLCCHQRQTGPYRAGLVADTAGHALEEEDVVVANYQNYGDNYWQYVLEVP